MAKYTQEELEDYRKKLHVEFVQKFDSQPSPGRLRFQEELLIPGGISKSTLSRAFKNARTLEEKADRPPADVACVTAYQFLLQNWSVSEGHVFSYIGPPLEVTQEEKVILHPRFPREAVQNALANGGNEVRIIDTYPSFLLSNQEHPEEINFLNWALQPGRKLKLLVLNPVGHGIDLRINAAITKPLLFEMPISAFRTALVAAFQQLLEFSKEHDGQLEVKLMDEFPAAHGVLMSNHTFFGFHFSHRLAHKASFFEIKGSNHLSIDFHQHFEKIWNEPHSSVKLDQRAFGNIKRVLEQKNHSWNSLVGRWEVYFQDKWQEDPSATLSKISRAVLEVDPPHNSALMEARLYFQDAELNRMQTFDGNVRFERLKEGEFAFLIFSDHENLSIRLIVRCKLDANNRFLLGHWVLTNAYDLNTSAIVLLRVNDKLYPSPQFDIPFPEIGHKGLLKTMAFRNQQSLSLNEFAEHNKTGKENAGVEMFNGTYKMYAYSLNRVQESKKLKKGIQLNMLHISPYGFVQYHSVKSTAFGVASVKRDNLYITLTDHSRDYRVGHFIFHTKDKKIEKDGVYAGVFLGITYRHGLPVARRVVLVKTDQEFGQEPPQHIVANSPEYHALDEGLKKALSGRIKNLIGFLRSNGDIFTLDELFEEWERSILFEENEFVDFACHYVQQKDIKKAIELLDRAVEFGFFDLQRFEDRIRHTEVFQTLIEDSKYKAIKERLSHFE